MYGKINISTGLKGKKNLKNDMSHPQRTEIVIFNFEKILLKINNPLLTCIYVV